MPGPAPKPRIPTDDMTTVRLRAADQNRLATYALRKNLSLSEAIGEILATFPITPVVDGQKAA